MTKEQFLERASLKHGSKYDYPDLQDNLLTTDKINLYCHEKYNYGEEHGMTTVSVGKHLNRGDACTKCSGRYKRTKSDFVKEANFIHNNQFNYDKFIWEGVDTKSVIHCNKHNLDFLMTPSHHLSGQGCKRCKGEKITHANIKIRTIEELKNKFKSIHGDKYDYSKVHTHNRTSHITITCKKHGDFIQTVESHIRRQGCPRCAIENNSAKRLLTKEEFVERAITTHGDTYDYSYVEYVSSTTKVSILCRQHGMFSMTPANHLYGQCCPKCSSFRSRGEREVEEFLKSLGINVEINNRKILGGNELDIFIPSHNLAIEYNGLYWHSTKFKDKDYHLNKTIRCEENNIALIQIFEDEWLNKQDIIKSRLKHFLGLTENKIFARKCQIKLIDHKTKSNFLTNHNLYGDIKSHINIGLFYQDELVLLMCFSNNNNSWGLLSYCSKKDTMVVGGFSKLLKYFTKNYNSEVLTYSLDRRWYSKENILKFGFNIIKYTKPNKFYLNDNKRFRTKSNDITQEDLMIYDSGNIVTEHKQKMG